MRVRSICLATTIVLMTILASQAFAGSGYWDWDFGVYGPDGKIGVTPVTTDGYDGEQPITYWDVPTTYAAIYHEEGINGWDGPTGFYRTDWAALVIPGQTKTWQIYVWSTPDMPADVATAGLFFENVSIGDGVIDNCQFQLRLKWKPSSITDGPEVGTVWNLYAGPGSQYGVSFPTYRTDDGLTGYHFEFSATVVPEPSALIAVLCGIGGLGRFAFRRRK